MKKLFCLLTIFVLLQGTVYAGLKAGEDPPSGAALANAPDPLQVLLDEAASYFRPLKGAVLSVEGERVLSDLGPESGAIVGMRVNVLRDSGMYSHPLTGVPIGHMETPVGVAEVISVSSGGVELANSGGAELTLISGEAQQGDTLRVSASKLRVLFHQGVDVSWSLSEEYYGVLKQTGRFDLVDSRLGSTPDPLVAEEARGVGASVALVLSEVTANNATALRQKLLWAEDSRVFSDTEVVLEPDFMRDLVFGDDMFVPKKEELLTSYELPFRATLITSGDVDGDGQTELLMSTGRDIVFYRPGIMLEPALGGQDIKGQISDKHLWLDTLDINADNKDEVIVTVMNNENISSRIYEFNEGTFTLLHEWDFYTRAVKGRLYGQKPSHTGGYTGPVFEINPAGRGAEGEAAATEEAALPENINLYDFSFVSGRGVVSESDEDLLLVFDDKGYLNLYGPETGVLLWRSAEDFGGIPRTFKKTLGTVMTDRGNWFVKDRVFTSGSSALVLQRIPFVNMARGIGYKNSRLKALRWNGTSMQEQPLVHYVPGNAVDFTVTGGFVYVLSSGKFDIKKAPGMLKGMSIFGHKLYAYPLKGVENAAK